MITTYFNTKTSTILSSHRPSRLFDRLFMETEHEYSNGFFKGNPPSPFTKMSNALGCITTQESNILRFFRDRAVSATTPRDYVFTCSVCNTITDKLLMYGEFGYDDGNYSLLADTYIKCPKCDHVYGFEDRNRMRPNCVNPVQFVDIILIRPKYQTSVDHAVQLLEVIEKIKSGDYRQC